MNNIKEDIKDIFLGCGVKKVEDGRVITYFTPESATELTDELIKYINKVREEAVRDFAKWYDYDVFPERGYAEAGLDNYFQSIKEQDGSR